MTQFSPDQISAAAGLAKIDPRGRAVHADTAVEDARKEIVTGAQEQKNKGPKISSINEARREAQRLEHGRSESAINNTFDDTLNVNAGTPKESKGVDRKKTAIEGRDLAEKYLGEKGADKLTTKEFKQISKQLEKIFAEQLGGTEAVAMLKAQGKFDVVMGEWIKDPEFRHNFREYTKDLINNPPEMAEVQMRINEAVQARQHAAEAATAKAVQIDKNAEDQLQTAKKLEQFNEEVKDAAGNVIKPAGVKRAELNGLKTVVDAGATDYKTKLAEIDILIKKYGGVRSEDGVITYTDAKQYEQLVKDRTLSEINTLQTGLIKYEHAMRECRALSGELDGLNVSQANLRAQEISLKKELDDARKEFFKNNAELDEAKIVRADVEKEYAYKWENAWSEAMKKSMNQEQAYMDAADNERHANEAVHEHDPVKKAAHEALGEYGYYGGIKVKRNGTIEDKMNKGHIKDHMRILTTTDRIKLAESFVNPATGKNYTKAEIMMAILSNPSFMDQFGKTQPEAVMRLLVMSRVNPATGRNFTLVEINTILAREPDAYKDIPREVALSLVKKSIISKQINTEQMKIISENPEWGGEHFTHDVMNDPAVHVKLEEWKAKGIKFDAGWTKDKKQWGLIALMLVLGGLPGAAIYLGAKSIGKKGATASHAA